MVPSPWGSVVLRRRVRLCSFELRATRFPNSSRVGRAVRRAMETPCSTRPQRWRMAILPWPRHRPPPPPPARQPGATQTWHTKQTHPGNQSSPKRDPQDPPPLARRPQLRRRLAIPL
eukprot:1870950-Prymnesium_polylepis.1